jgi:ubiquinol-cytochrome c reductase cytochrome b subunit
MSKIGDWLDERLGHRALTRWFLEEPVPGGARWSYVFGSVLVFLFALQALTGILLASFYAPSATDAWASVAYVQTQVTLGWFIRGLHSSGASAMVVVVCLHLLQVTLWGAYRKPRELNWWVGLVMMGCLFGFALTGYLLPWDQKGYWATQVATSLMGAAPLVGPWLKSVVQGGPEYGNLTLTHFYALHVVVLPATLAALTVLHVALFRKHGVTPKWNHDAKIIEPFWPGQLVRDFGAMTLTLAILFYAVARGHGAPLEAPADPASAYDARPEWYFYPLFQLLKFFPGTLEIVAAIGAPLVAGGLLMALPFYDRAPTTRASTRKLAVGTVLLLLFGAAALGAGGAASDARNPGYQKFRQRAEKASERALKLAEAGVPPAGGLAIEQNDPLSHGRKLFKERCSGCHLLDGEGERRAPDLDGWSSRNWLRAFLKAPDDERFYGKTKVRGMKPVKAEGPDLDALVEWLYSQGGDAPGAPGAADEDEKLAARGKEVFELSGCDQCHDSDGKTASDGPPNLGGRAQPAWIHDFLSDPSDGRFFDGKNQMPKFRGKLSDAELDALAALLSAERKK